MPANLPRMIISALKGDSGKTMLSIGVVSALREKSYKVATFKKGPDFIDAGWLSFVSARPCYNLDPFLMTKEQILNSFLVNSSTADISLIEGNRGLFDGLDLEGQCSTAELAKTLKTPVFIIVDVTMVTRTAAALIMGCQKFDPDLEITGIILNRVGGFRHQSLIRNSIEKYCDVPVVGAIPKLKGNMFPERHMGLVPHIERTYAAKAVEWARKVVEENVDLDRIREIACKAKALHQSPQVEYHESPVTFGGKSLRIGIIRDKAFWFYYPENLDHLRHMGAELVEINSMIDSKLPELDALYIGGGFPEMQAHALASNSEFRTSLRLAIERGLPVYAECGGLIYLGEDLIVDHKTYPMVGAIPMKFLMEKKPQGHGYTVLEVCGENPFYSPGTVLKGHEFHYSKPLPKAHAKIPSVFKVIRGRGLDGSSDGVVRKNLLATYSHVHARGNKLWGKGLFSAAIDFRNLGEKKFSK